MLRINIGHRRHAEMTEASATPASWREGDRQAVFKSDCASCHLKKTEVNTVSSCLRHLRRLPRGEKPRHHVPDLRNLRCRQ